MRDLRGRMFFSRILFATLIVSLVWTVSNVVAPYTVPPGSAVGLDGNANIVDNGEVYDGLWFFPRLVYYIGDAQCHQLSYRTIWLNGNQMPMDARMESIYLFATVGLLSAMFAVPSTSVSQGLLNALPRSWAAWGRKHLGPSAFAFLLVFLGLLPVAVDGFVQLFTVYESTNLKRVLTGIPTGWVSGLLVGVMMTSIRQVDVETQALRARGPLSRRA